MSDNLRDRIAAAIYAAVEAWDDFPFADLTPHAQMLYLAQADEVVRELGLRRETVYAWKGSRSVQTGIRYVTDWLPTTHKDWNGCQIRHAETSSKLAEGTTWGCGDERCKACH